MKITILTLFPEMFDGFVNTSIIKRAIDKKVVEISVVNFRDYSLDKTKRVDDAPYGGGAGMILKLQPLMDCLKDVRKENSKVYLLSASGKKFNQQMAHEMASEIEDLVLICGHYEGVDARLLNYIDGEICIGEYILTGGELASQVVSDAIIRLLDGAINEDSTKEESFENSLLEYPQYTAPRVYENYEVPKILFSGNHEAIEEYHFKESVRKTKEVNPSLIDESKFSKKQLKWYKELENNEVLENAVNKAKKFTK